MLGNGWPELCEELITFCFRINSFAKYFLRLFIHHIIEIELEKGFNNWSLCGITSNDFAACPGSFGVWRLGGSLTCSPFSTLRWRPQAGVNFIKLFYRNSQLPLNYSKTAFSSFRRLSLLWSFIFCSVQSDPILKIKMQQNVGLHFRATNELLKIN